jgi:hypothetical protein
VVFLEMSMRNKFPKHVPIKKNVLENPRVAANKKCMFIKHAASQN